MNLDSQPNSLTLESSSIPKDLYENQLQNDSQCKNYSNQWH